MPNYATTVYGPGALAYVDSFAGLVPCKVEAVDGPEVTVKLTATRGAYRKGETITARQSGVVPRDKVRTRSGSKHILSSFAWANVEAPAHLHLGPCLEGVRPGDAVYMDGNSNNVGIVQSIAIRYVGPGECAIELTTNLGVRVIDAHHAEAREDGSVHYRI